MKTREILGTIVQVIRLFETDERPRRFFWYCELAQSLCYSCWNKNWHRQTRPLPRLMLRVRPPVPFASHVPISCLDGWVLRQEYVNTCLSNEFVTDRLLSSVLLWLFLSVPSFAMSQAKLPYWIGIIFFHPPLRWSALCFCLPFFHVCDCRWNGARAWETLILIGCVIAIRLCPFFLCKIKSCFF